MLPNPQYRKRPFSVVARPGLWRACTAATWTDDTIRERPVYRYLLGFLGC